MRILITGTAGFLGSYVTERLAEAGHELLAIDNVNSYYDPSLKWARLRDLGVEHELGLGAEAQSARWPGLTFVRRSLEEYEPLLQRIASFEPERICHLAAQAGVRYSLDHPKQYVDSNVTGTLTLLEAGRRHGVDHLVYASSSSVYGNTSDVPFRTEQRVDTPISLYAATKRANELMAHTYSHLYGTPQTGLRFFTVYGPRGRPDMAYFEFTRRILAGEPIDVYGHGKLSRDFTYVDDVVESVVRVLDHAPSADEHDGVPHRVLNVGNGSPVNLLDFIEAIEAALGKTATKNMLGMQPGDVENTWADSAALERITGFRPNTPLINGVQRFAEWYRDHYRTG